MQKIKNFILSTTASLLLILGLMPAYSYAIDCTRPNLSAKEAVQCGACQAAGKDLTKCDSGQAETRLNDTVAGILNILSIVVGVVAVIMIIIGGFRYVVSAGNEQSVAGAKRTILYAIVGLLVVALAQVIVQFVLVRTT